MKMDGRNPVHPARIAVADGVPAQGEAGAATADGAGNATIGTTTDVGLGRPVLLLLVGISTIGPLALNGVLPATSAIMAELATTYGLAQLVLTVYLFATLASQIVLGPLADRRGRRPVMIGSLLLFAVGSLACALAPSIELLLLARFVQGFGGAVCMFLPRTIVRDVHPRDKAASVIGYMTTAMMVAPMFGPALGGWITDQTSWRWMYLGLAGLGVTFAALAARSQPETLGHESGRGDASAAGEPTEGEGDVEHVGEYGLEHTREHTGERTREHTREHVGESARNPAGERVEGRSGERAARPGSVDRTLAGSRTAVVGSARREPSARASSGVGASSGKTVGNAAEGEASRPFRALLGERAFVAYALLMAGSVGVYYTFLAGAPYVAMESRGLDASTFGRWFAMVAVGYLTGNLVAGRFSERIGVSRMIVLGLVPFTLGIVLFWALSAWSHPLGLFLPMQLVAFSNGVSLPNMISGAMSVRPAIAASASGLAGGLQTAFGVLLTLAVGLVLPSADAWLFALVTLSGTVTAAGLWIGRRSGGTPGAVLAKRTA